MKKRMTGELQGVWMHGHGEEWRPAISRVVHWTHRRRGLRTRRAR
ncbi:MAG TPA: hypothetical protein VGH20_11775 [Myxococcales bacterium]